MALTEAYSKATRMTGKKARDLEAKLNLEAQEENDDWWYSVEPTDHEKRFIVAVYDEDNYLLGYL
jgi:hypothetical protein